MLIERLFKINNDQDPLAAYLGILSIICLVIAPFPWPYGYYQILKIVLFATNLFLGSVFYTCRSMGWLVACLFMGVIYNPIFPIYFHDKSLWTIINLITAIVVFIAVKARYRISNK